MKQIDQTFLKIGLIIILPLLFLFDCAYSQVTLPGFFSSQMIFQREQPIQIWGWASSGERVEVQFGNETKRTRANKNGEWSITFPAKQAGGPFSVLIKTKNETINLSDVLVGDVWICSGQSNMEWIVMNTDNAEKEIASADIPKLRHVTIPKGVAIQPQNNVTNTEWKVTKPENVANFSAVAYYFGKELVNELDVPIGLINTSWGGTQIESWISRSGFENHPYFKDMIARLPNINLDSLRVQNERKTKEFLQGIQPNLNPSSQEVAKWKNAGYDDSNWNTMQVPQLWENGPLPNVDGKIWLRKSFRLNKEQASNLAVLHLAKIDDADITYINGIEIGKTNQYNQDRVYNVPANILKEGDNVIAVRVEDTGGGGGIYGDPSNVKLISGGSTISLSGDWKFQIESISTSSSVGPNQYPTLLYNAMIHPLVPFPIKGAIWYQGEANAGRAKEYQISFPLMINDWREKWEVGDFPFYFVQLATFNANNGTSSTGSTWAELREAQTITASQVPNTGMAITTDIGDPEDIHPRNKRDVGKRLAALALAKTYDKKMVSEGPTFESMQKEGNSIVLSFKNVGSGLMVKDKYGYVKGFEVAGEDKKFHYAKASIEGDKVVVNSENVKDPVAVRYNWADDAGDGNLYNEEGFPAVPFRTDDWKGVTEEVKYSF